MEQPLWIDLRNGISGDKLAAALIGLGAPERGMVHTILAAGEELGILDVHSHLQFLSDEIPAHQLHITSQQEQEPVPLADAPDILEKALIRAGVGGHYAHYAHQVLSILRTAESQAHAPNPPAPAQTASLPLIGVAHTPYQHQAPYQPRPENFSDGAFYIQLEPQYAAATQSLETFSHIFVLSYLDRALEAELTVRPPWTESSERYGVFATRSPNRPAPIGLTRVRLRYVEGNRIYTSPLDLFDGTPILDIKPFIRSLDGMIDDENAGNDGWLEGSAHLELHRLGIPHAHPGGFWGLDKPHIFIPLLVGVAWGLQSLDINLASVKCVAPLNIGLEATLELTTRLIMDLFKIPSQSGDISDKLVTPEGAAILAALSPICVQSKDVPQSDMRSGWGLGSQALDGAPNSGALRLFTQI